MIGIIGNFDIYSATFFEQYSLLLGKEFSSFQVVFACFMDYDFILLRETIHLLCTVLTSRNSSKSSVSEWVGHQGFRNASCVNYYVICMCNEPSKIY